MSGFPNKKYQQEGAEAGDVQKRSVRLTMHSTDLRAIENVCKSFVEAAKSKKFDVSGPVRLPVRKLRITTRKTPCGQGSKTWDKFEMRVYKRVIDIFGTDDQLDSIPSLAQVEHGVDVQVMLRN